MRKQILLVKGNFNPFTTTCHKILALLKRVLIDYVVALQEVISISQHFVEFLL